jgi:hypothetical protein
MVLTVSELIFLHLQRETTLSYAVRLCHHAFHKAMLRGQ